MEWRDKETGELVRQVARTGEWTGTGTTDRQTRIQGELRQKSRKV